MTDLLLQIRIIPCRLVAGTKWNIALLNEMSHAVRAWLKRQNLNTQFEKTEDEETIVQKKMSNF